MEENNAEPKPQKNPYLIPGAIVMAGALIAVAVFMSPGGSTEANPSGAAGTEDIEDTLTLHDWEQTDGNSVGSPDAPVTITEYSDYACPFCQRFWSQTLPQIKEEYIDTGQVRFVYVDFPVVGGDRAAEAIWCADEQDAFWQYHDVLFSRSEADKQKWAQSDVHRGYAEVLDLDADALVECFEERRYQQMVQDNAQQAQEAGAQGTPFFLVNGNPIEGAQPFSAFQEVIEAELN